MASEDSELMEVAEIMLQLASLNNDSDLQSSLPFSWGSKKPRTRPTFSPNKSLDGKKRKSCFSSLTAESSRKKKKVSLPDLNLPLPNKISPSGKKRKSCISSVTAESSRKKKKKVSGNKGFLLPDLNFPLPNKN